VFRQEQGLVQELEQGFSPSGAGIAGPDDPLKWTARRNVIVAMYDDERDRLARFSKLALDAGLERRRVELAENQAGLVATVIMGLLDSPRLGLTREQRDLGRRLAGGHLRLLSGAVDASSEEK
jgi:hypothetical protein